MMYKDTFFSKKQSLNFRGRLLHFDSVLIMGIINITPDSFYNESRLSDPQKIHEKVAGMISSGAHIIDIGACSTRPGAECIPEKEELKRLSEVLPMIRDSFPETILSVDTFRAGIARKVVEEFGVDMINDISGGNLDPEMFPTIADLQVPYVLMHMKGSPANMQDQAFYKDVVQEIIQEFSEKINRANQMGINDIILDPGFGFAKTADHNFEILNKLETFHIFNQPLMAGISRKSMIYKAIGSSPAQALNGSTALHTIALMKGVNILRVHDVREAWETILLVQKTLNAG